MKVMHVFRDLFEVVVLGQDCLFNFGCDLYVEQRIVVHFVY